MAGLLNGVLPDVNLGLGVGGDDGGAGATTTPAPTSTAATASKDDGKPTESLGSLPNVTANPGSVQNPAKGVDDPGNGEANTSTTKDAGNNGNASGNGGGQGNDNNNTAAPDSTTTTHAAGTEATTTAKTTAAAVPESTSTKGVAVPQTSTTALTPSTTSQATSIQATTSAPTGLPSTLLTSVLPGLESDASSVVDLTSILPTSLITDGTSLLLATSTGPLPSLAETLTQSASLSSLISSSASGVVASTSLPASNEVTQASTTSSGTGMTKAAAIGIGVGGGVGALALAVTSILLCRRYWRKRRDANDEALQDLDAMYEKGKPVDWVEHDTSRWNKGLEVFHDATKPAELAGSSTMSRVDSVRSQQPLAK